MSAPKKQADRGQYVIQAKREAIALYRALHPRNLEPAVQYLHANPPSAEAVAMLAMWLTPEAAVAGYKSAKNKHASGFPRPSRLRERVRRLNVRSKGDFYKQLPHEWDKYMEKYGPDVGKIRINDLISKAWKHSKSP